MRNPVKFNANEHISSLIKGKDFKHLRIVFNRITDIVKKVSMGRCYGVSHRMAPGSIKFQKFTDNGIHFVGYGERGLVNFYVICDEENRDEIIKEVANV
jgi:hypothetical protein